MISILGLVFSCVIAWFFFGLWDQRRGIAGITALHYVTRLVKSIFVSVLFLLVLWICFLIFVPDIFTAVSLEDQS